MQLARVQFRAAGALRGLYTVFGLRSFGGVFRDGITLAVPCDPASQNIQKKLITIPAYLESGKRNEFQFPMRSYPFDPLQRIDPALRTNFRSSIGFDHRFNLESGAILRAATVCEANDR